MLTYREATLADAKAIARLHAQSWQQHFRGILRDEYLARTVHEDRQSIWAERLQHPSAKQHVILALDQGEPCGFACTYALHDPQWGALLDNLHVLADWQGRGIGQALMRQSAQWVQQQPSPEGLYLWVFEANVAASAFYERNGGVRQERIIVDNPGGGQAPVFRYVWPDLAVLGSAK